MHIYIPTRGRAHQQITYDQLPLEWQMNTTWVVDSKDAGILHARYGDKRHQGQIVVHPTEVDTIAKKRAWILATTEHKKIVMFDDDLRFSVRREKVGPGLAAATVDQVGAHLIDLSIKLEELAHAGWSHRQGNNRLPYGWLRNTRMMYVLGYRPEIVRAHCVLGRIEHREDMDYALQLLRAGYANEVDYRIAADQRYNAPGGASLERTREASDADAHKLAELHPGLVKAEHRTYAHSPSRVEVTCFWKKAYRWDEEQTARAQVGS